MESKQDTLAHLTICRLSKKFLNASEIGKFVLFVNHFEIKISKKSELYRDTEVPELQIFELDYSVSLDITTTLYLNTKPQT